MKSLSFGSMLFFILFYLSACTNTTVFFWGNKMPTENITTNQKMQTTLNILPDESVIIDEYNEIILNETKDPNVTNIEVVSGASESFSVNKVL